MTARFWLGLTLSWARITTIFLVDVALLVIASHCPDARQTGHAAWWVGVGVAALVTIAATVSYAGYPLASAPVARVRNWYADPEALTAGCTPAVDHWRRFGREVVGVRECEGRLVTAIAVGWLPDALSGRHHHRSASPAALPMRVVATALRQFDVRLDGIDIVSVGTADADDQSSPGERSTWLVLRMDPLRNTAAVAVRDSLASTLAAATERLAQELEGLRYAARPLSATEISDMDAAMLAGIQPGEMRPYWRYLKHSGGYVTSFWVSPRDITEDALGKVWLLGADVTVVTIRLAARRGGTYVSAFVRCHSNKRLRTKSDGAMNRLIGRQLGAVSASLPAPTPKHLVLPSRPLGDEEDTAVSITVGDVIPQYSESPAGMAR